MCYKYANYIINKINELNAQRENENKNKIFLNNKRLQKILFLAYASYAHKYKGKKLFSDDFYAWDYGPVIPNVYYTYSLFQIGSMKPLSNDYMDLPDDKKQVLDEIIEKTSDIKLRALIDATHRGKPYKKYYSSEKLNRIPSNEIIQYYRNDKHYKDLMTF